jgi:hypothetical protein
MNASPSTSFPAVIRGDLSTPILRELLLGNRSLRSALEAGGNRANHRVYYTKVAPETTVGFIPFPEHPRQIIVARLPFTNAVVPAVELRPGRLDWAAFPQMVSWEQLIQYEGVALKADWIDCLINLAATLKNPKTHRLGVDKTLLAIGAAWDRWEREKMTWPQRSKNLARITNLPELARNTLEVKCKRLGLIRSDNKAR